MRGRRGAVLVEVAVASAVVALLFGGVVAAYNTLVSVAGRNAEEVKAALLLEEGLEAVRFIRDGGWSGNIAPLSLEEEYFLNWGAAGWEIGAAPEAIGGFSRSFALFPVERNSDGDIVAAGEGADDPGTRRVAVSVSWEGRGRTHTRTIEGYIANLVGE